MRTHTRVRSAVLALAPKTAIPPACPETPLGDDLLSTPMRAGRTRWWKAWVTQEGTQLKRNWRHFWEQQSVEVTGMASAVARVRDMGDGNPWWRMAESGVLRTLESPAGREKTRVFPVCSASRGDKGQRRQGTTASA
jgi:hypothetical protein